MEAVVILIVIVILGVLIGTGLALVRGRRRDSGVLEPPPVAPPLVAPEVAAPVDTAVIDEAAAAVAGGGRGRAR